MGEDRSGLLPSCCGKYERGFRCGACPEDDALVDSMVGNPAQRVRLMALLAALTDAATRLRARAEQP